MTRYSSLLAKKIVWNEGRIRGPALPLHNLGARGVCPEGKSDMSGQMTCALRHWGVVGIVNSLE